MANKNKGKKKKELVISLNTMWEMVQEFLKKSDRDMAERDYEKVAVEALDFLSELSDIIERQFWSDSDN